MTHTPGPWREGTSSDSVVCDLPNEYGGADHAKYYGGYLVAESIQPSNRPLVIAAPDMHLILNALRLGVAEFDQLGALRLFCNGVWFTTSGDNWKEVCDAIGRDNLRTAIEKAPKPTN